jgi:hypothetical protein
VLWARADVPADQVAAAALIRPKADDAVGRRPGLLGASGPGL